MHGNTKHFRAFMSDVHRVKVGRKYWLFTYSEMCGPLLTDQYAEPVDNTPLADEEHPFWDAFEQWQKDRIRS